MSKEHLQTPTRLCEWCRLPLDTPDGRRKYHKINIHGIHCRDEARKYKTNHRVQNHYKKYPDIQKKKDIEKLGTFDLDLPFRLKDAPMETYLGKLITADLWTREYDEIHKLLQEIRVKPSSKRKQQEKNTQHKGVTLYIYDNFNIIFQLENPGPCPVCGEKLQDKDITRAELICRNPDCEGKGGLVIKGTEYHIDYPETPGNRMAFTTRDISDSQTYKQHGKDISIQNVAWDNYWKKK